MLGTIVHRGPDDQGIYDGGHAVLGVRRLKIIDLEGGHQPLSNEDGTVWVVYNGEIYNHAALHQELEARGHRFTTRCDTEVLVHAWEEWGSSFVDRFQGMFGFAIWDSADRHAGPRPRPAGHQAACTTPGTDRDWCSGRRSKRCSRPATSPASRDLDAIYHYVGYEFVPAPATMFRDVRKLPAGHLLLVEKGALSIRQYWDVSFAPQERVRRRGNRRRPPAPAATPSRKRLMSDVPLGVFVSGRPRLDGGARVRARSVDQPHPDLHDRLSAIHRSANGTTRVASRSTTAPIITRSSSSPSRRRLIEHAVWHLDEPMTDLSSIPFGVLSAQARKHVTVCLSGEGGDEVFVGYDRFIASKLNHTALRPHARRGPPRGRGRGQAAARPGAEEGRRQHAEALRRGRRAARGRRAHALAVFLVGRAGPARCSVRSSWRAFAAIRSSRFAASAPASGTADRLAQECYVDLRLTMPDSVLMKVDKMSMAHSLEVRVPFLDHALVEFVASIPSRAEVPRAADQGDVPEGDGGHPAGLRA